ncbi:MAG TPA: CapA family protein [Candidatus Saccharimonadales bacterium]
MAVTDGERWLKAGLIIVGLIIIGFTGWRINQLDDSYYPGVSDESAPAATPAPVQAKARWLFMGEVFWGRQMERIAETQPDPTSYLFSRLNTFNREQYDAWIAHLECPVADKVIPFEVQANDLIFNCQPKYLEEFEEWFNAVSLANNHIDNVNGVAGLDQTRANLESVGVQYYGHFDNSVRDDICEIASLPIKVEASDKSVRESKLPVALCGYHNVFRLPTKEELDVIKNYAGQFLTIVSPQQGAEYQPKGDEFKQEVYRGMIDRGADMVIASHPHWVQNTEVYKGKLIMYSVGNFMFDQEWSDEVMRGVALDLGISLIYDDNLAAWLELGQKCETFQDNCLKLATQQKLTKLEFNFSYELVSAWHKDALTRKAPDNIHRLNLERTNWVKTLSQLEQL